MIQQVEKYLVNIVDAESKLGNFQELCANQFYFCKASTHQNLLPTGESLKPRIQHTYYNTYTTVHILGGNLAFKLETLILWIMALHF